MPNLRDLVDGRSIFAVSALAPKPKNMMYPGKKQQPPPDDEDEEEVDPKATDSQDPEEEDDPEDPNAAQPSDTAQHIANHIQDPVGTTQEMFQDLTEKKLAYDMSKAIARQGLAPVKAILQHVEQAYQLNDQQMMMNPDAAGGYQETGGPGMPQNPQAMPQPGGMPGGMPQPGQPVKQRLPQGGMSNVNQSPAAKANTQMRTPMPPTNSEQNGNVPGRSAPPKQVKKKAGKSKSNFEVHIKGASYAQPPRSIAQMSASASLDRIIAGGPGSGCKGDNCGRKPKVGDRVKIASEYGGGKGEVVESHGSFHVVQKKGGITESHHEANLTVTGKQRPPGYHSAMSRDERFHQRMAQTSTEKRDDEEGAESAKTRNEHFDAYNYHHRAARLADAAGSKETALRHYSAADAHHDAYRSTSTTGTGNRVSVDVDPSLSKAARDRSRLAHAGLEAAGDSDIESWITVGGTHIPIRKGQSKHEAVTSHINKHRGGGAGMGSPAERHLSQNRTPATEVSRRMKNRETEEGARKGYNKTGGAMRHGSFMNYLKKNHPELHKGKMAERKKNAPFTQLGNKKQGRR
jgi:hypothetical protein